MTGTVVCRAEELASGEAKRVMVAGLPVCLVRIEDDFYAIGDICTHQNISLAEGEVLVEEKSIECWKHGSAFSLETGEPNSLPATRPEPVFKVELEDGNVVVYEAPPGATK